MELKVGELARRTGLTVRTLHHWEEVGLLEAPARTEAGYRLYGDADLRRVLRIAALRTLGLSLEDVAGALGGGDPAETLRGQLEEVERRIAREEEHRARLERLLDGMGGEPTTDWLLEAIEVMTMFEKHYTPEQLATLDERRRELGDEGMQRAERDWADLIADVRAARERGTAPGDPRLDPLLERWSALVSAFTGGDPGIERSLGNLWREDGEELRERHGDSDAMPDPALMAYVAEARRVREQR